MVHKFNRRVRGRDIEHACKSLTMREKMFLSLVLFLSQLLQLSSADPEECIPTRCHSGPIIRFPFWLKNHHYPDHCTYPGFDLSCSQNTTIIELPFSVKLAVKEIDYESQLIHTLDPHDCFPLQLPTLNLSTSPFQFSRNDTHGFSFFNCSSSTPHKPYINRLVSCLGDSIHKVYSIYSGTSLYYDPLLSCKKMFSISSVPSEIFDPPYQLKLKWSDPPCWICEAQSKRCGLKNSSSSRAQHQTECFDIPKQPTTVVDVLRGLFLLLVVIILVYCVTRLIKRRKEDQLKIEKFLEDYIAQKPARYSYADIKTITNKFQDKIGKGGYGEVYQGKLSNDVRVAVKILDNVKGSGDDFINEVGTIGRIHHVNVVRLVGYCADGFHRGLIYEFMPNQSLEKYIFSDQEKYSLGWEKLHDIALGIAKGIEYLHQGCDQQILHFDIKPQNILLDHNFNPKISDFGLAKLCLKEQSAISMTVARGTVGYIAPEVFSRNFGKASSKSDVYSFGMLLLDIAGVRNRTVTESAGEVYFPEWIYNRLEKGEELGIQIGEDRTANIVKKLIIVGLWCTQWCPMNRPSMKVVVHMLEAHGSTLTAPPNPFTSKDSIKAKGKMVRRSISELEIISESE